MKKDEFIFSFIFLFVLSLDPLLKAVRRLNDEEDIKGKSPRYLGETNQK